MASVKTVCGLALASVKTVEGLAAASLKTVLGLDAAAGGASYAFTETFEGSNTDSQAETGYDNTSWTSSSATNTPRDTSSPSPLSGTYSWRSGSGAFLSRTFTAADAFHCYFKINIVTKSDNQTVFQLRGSTTALFTLLTRATDVFRISHGTVNSANGTAPLAAGTTYHVWIDWAKGTGADGTCAIYTATTATKPGSPDISMSNGNATAQADNFRMFGVTVSVFDNYVHDTTQTIGSNPV